MKRVTLILIVVLVGVVALAQTYDSPTPMASWRPPTEGSPVVVYHLQVLDEVMGEIVFSVSTPDTFYRIPPGVMQPLEGYIARVRGEDAVQRVGPWSLPSDVYVYDPGAPGEPSQMTWETR
jgi:hypothetical protein